ASSPLSKWRPSVGPTHRRNKLGAQEGEVEHLELCASVKVLELLIYWLRNLGAHPLSLEHLEVGFEHLEFPTSQRRAGRNQRRVLGVAGVTKPNPQHFSNFSTPTWLNSWLWQRPPYDC